MVIVRARSDPFGCARGRLRNPERPGVLRAFQSLAVTSV